ncbi:MAG: mechanosensitive ion channel family protein [Alphaproteobacteria bacterium]|nr:mechanosensitive ion channel family protein [Alphaproteobacteria bacterium]
MEQQDAQGGGADIAPLGDTVEQNLEAVGRGVDFVLEFALAYGFQIMGALIFLVIGLKVSGWAGRKITALARAKQLDETLAKFTGNLVKLVLIAMLVIITLGNFGISIAPLIALAGAGAFGATMAIQGPLSNYGAGLSIILTRPFVVGDTITVKGVSGVVDDIRLAHTTLIGEDAERITIPNKEIVGEVIVNSDENRIVEARIAVGADSDLDAAIAALRGVLEASDGVSKDVRPHVGVHDFTYGGVVLGLRYWVPSKTYFQTRYAVNARVLQALDAAGVKLLHSGVALDPRALSGDQAMHG